MGVQDRLTAPVRPALIVLMAAAGLVLLVACANVANLLLAQAAAREREVVAHLVLGASRGRLLRQSLTESLCLALLGGGVGIGLTHAGVRLLPTIAASLSRRDRESAVILPRLDEVAIDGSVLVFTVVVSVLTGVLFGVVPARRQARTGSADVLRQSGGFVASGFDVRDRSRAPGLLVACQVGVALVLCAGSALLIRSFVQSGRRRPRLRCRGSSPSSLPCPPAATWSTSPRCWSTACSRCRAFSAPPTPDSFPWSGRGRWYPCAPRPNCLPSQPHLPPRRAW